MRHVVGRALLLFCIGMACLNYFIVAWGIPQNETLLRGLGAPLDVACDWRMHVVFCPNPPVKGDWKISELLRTILEDPECRQRTCTLTVLTEDGNFFNYAVLRYYRVQDFPDAHLKVKTIRGPRTLRNNSTSVFHPPSLDWSTSDYLVYISQLSGRYLYGDAVVRVLEKETTGHQPRFKEIRNFEMPSGWTAHLVRRTKSLDLNDMHALITKLEVPEQMKKELLDIVSRANVPSL